MCIIKEPNNVIVVYMSEFILECVPFIFIKESRIGRKLYSVHSDLVLQLEEFEHILLH